MGSSFQYNVLSGFRAIGEWQAIISRNAQGLLIPGYNRVRPHFGNTMGAAPGKGRLGTASAGGASGMYGQADTLAFQGTTLDIRPGNIEPAFNPTALAIRGSGFFVLAENLLPGAKLFLSRNGDFRYDAQGRLVNQQGLYVVGGNGVLSDPPVPVTNPGDGTVVLPSLTLANVPVPSQLRQSGYGSVVYEATLTSGPIQPYANGRPEVGFVQASSLEQPDQVGAIGDLQIETHQAQQTYKLFKDMLDSFNKTDDDAIGLVR